MTTRACEGRERDEVRALNTVRRPVAGARWAAWQRQRRSLLLLGLGWAAVSAAIAAPLVAGPAGAPMALADAVRAAADGDTIDLLPGDYAGGLVIDQRRLTLRGMGKVVVKGDGKLADGAHALWTVRGGDVTVENVEFRGARAADGSGAGLRQEGGKLAVRRCTFYDNEHGVLATNVDSAELTIDASVFGLAPHTVGGLYHLLNVGRIGKLTITGSRFQQGFEGHLVKTRARVATIAYNFIHDGPRGGASYEIDIANGGEATVVGNVIAQGAESQNRVVVAYGAEGRAWDKNTLLLAHNTFVNYGWTPAWFVRSFKDKLGKDTEVWAVNNLVVGPGIFWLGADGHFEGNRHAAARMLRDIATYGFELPPDSVWRGVGVDPRSVGGHDLSPKAEFEWPAGTRPIEGPRRSWTPGAYQR